MITVTLKYKEDLDQFITMLKFNSPGVYYSIDELDVTTNATIEAIDDSLFDCGIEDYSY